MQPSLRYTLEKKKTFKKCVSVNNYTTNNCAIYTPDTVQPETIIIFISPCVLDWKTSQ